MAAFAKSWRREWLGTASEPYGRVLLSVRLSGPCKSTWVGYWPEPFLLSCGLRETPPWSLGRGSRLGADKESPSVCRGFKGRQRSPNIPVSKRTTKRSITIKGHKTSVSLEKLFERDRRRARREP